MKSRRTPTVRELLAALKTVPLREQYLQEEDDAADCEVYGLADPDGRVTVNEAVHLVPTVLHEVTHVLRPGWAEATVDRRATALYRRLSPATIRRIHRAYKARVRRAPTIRPV